MRRAKFSCKTGQTEVRDATPEEEAQVQVTYDTTTAQEPERVRVAELDAQISSDTVLGSFKSMTNAEFDAWWDANVTTAAQAIGVLKRLARVVIRRVL